MVLENGKITNLMQSKIRSIAGDASFRKFYRLTLNKSSKIIALVEKEKYKNLIIYSTINKFLRDNGIFAPRVFTQDYAKGIMIMEDFGDLTFHKILLGKRNKLPVYKKLVDLLIKIQKIQPKKKLRTIFAKSHIIDKYSIKYLHQESDLFFDWYLPLFFNQKKVVNMKLMIKKILSKPKTKKAKDLLVNLGVQEKKILVLTGNLTENLILSMRNIPKIALLDAMTASAYDLLDSEIILIDQKGLEMLNDGLADK